MQKGNAVKVKEQSIGMWTQILPALGVGKAYLENKHGPCPLCGGKDRYRFDDKNGRGTFYCRCGPGDGFDLLMRINNWTFPEVASRVEEFLTGAGQTLGRQKPKTEKDPVLPINKILSGVEPVKEGDQVSQYLVSRGLNKIPESIMFHPNLYESERGKNCVGMVAKIQSASGEVISLHRTFLQDGKKASINSPRKVLSPIGALNGGAIRLYPATTIVGLAEGIETSIAAHEVFGIPVWSVMNTNGLETFVPPEGIKNILILGDNDHNFAGQKAAYYAANKLALKKYQVRVDIPKTPGNDWLDEFIKNAVSK
jgi:putative DNA primase/helicase